MGTNEGSRAIASLLHFWARGGINDRRPLEVEARSHWKAGARETRSSGRIRPMTASTAPSSSRTDLLRGVVDTLIASLKGGEADRDRRRQVEDWLRGLAEKYPEFKIETGLRDYYQAEAQRLRAEFDATSDLSERLNLGRSIESYLDKAAEYARRAEEAEVTPSSS